MFNGVTSFPVASAWLYPTGTERPKKMNNSDAGGFDVTCLTGFLLRSLRAAPWGQSPLTGKEVRSPQPGKTLIRQERKTPDYQWCWGKWHFRVAVALLVSYALASSSDRVLAQLKPDTG
jgi:hypothetical protein